MYPFVVVAHKSAAEPCSAWTVECARPHMSKADSRKSTVARQISNITGMISGRLCVRFEM
jgi:hypothetical protein